jgi:hypothetical protein
MIFVPYGCPVIAHLLESTDEDHAEVAEHGRLVLLRRRQRECSSVCGHRAPSASVGAGAVVLGETAMPRFDSRAAR